MYENLLDPCLCIFLHCMSINPPQFKGLREVFKGITTKHSMGSLREGFQYLSMNKFQFCKYLEPQDRGLGLCLQHQGDHHDSRVLAASYQMNPHPRKIR